MKLRIALGFLLPPLLGFIAVSWSWIFAFFKSWDLDLLQLMGVFAIFAFLIVGILSFLYSIIMEFVINQYIHNSVIAISISMLLGAAVGTTVEIDRATYSLVGAIVGLFMGYLLRKLYNKEQANKALQLTSKSGTAEF